MHHVPAVAYPVHRYRPLGFVAFSAWLISGVVLATWAWQSGRAQGASDLSVSLQHAGVVLAWVACGIVAGWQWHAMKPGTLRFDGLVWEWVPAAITAPPITASHGRLTVALDLQRHLLLNWHEQGDSCAPGKSRTSVWLWLRADTALTHWHGLRCAVYSPAAGQNPSPAVGLHV